MEYNIYPHKTDLFIENNNYNYIYKNKVEVLTHKKNSNTYKTIFFNNLDRQNYIKNTLKKELLFYFNKLNIKKGNHILIVGIGNDNYTADSVGSKALKHIKVNSFINYFNIETNDTIISALEPGVLSETGILTEKIIKSVTKEIKPDLIILIDSFVSNDINYLNKTIELSDKGLTTGLGIKKINSNIDKKLLNIPVITIGVTTAIEVTFSQNSNINYIPYILSTKDIDIYVNKISKIIGYGINDAIDNLK